MHKSKKNLKSMQFKIPINSTKHEKISRIFSCPEKAYINIYNKQNKINFVENWP